jgi:hypothetical protein
LFQGTRLVLVPTALAFVSIVVHSPTVEERAVWNLGSEGRSTTQNGRCYGCETVVRPLLLFPENIC